VVFQFHLVQENEVVSGESAKMRPNRLGVSTCALVAVDELDLHVRGLDAIAGSPVLDVKPFMREFEPTESHPAMGYRAHGGVLLSRHFELHAAGFNGSVSC
jgi:tRNA (Thr-GGU) A37 N-methylase